MRCHILVADQDRFFLKDITTENDHPEVRPLVTSDVTEATKLLREPGLDIVGVFINPSISAHWVNLVIRVLEVSPGAPLFLLQDKSPASPLELSDEELKGMGIRAVIEKPILFDRFYSHLKTFADRIEIPSLPERISEEGEYLAVPIDQFLNGCPLIFDLFMSLDQGKKHLKILKKGDALDLKRVEEYLNKGARCFYIRKSQREEYLGYCHEILARLIEQGKASEVAPSISQLGETTYEHLRELGLSENTLEMARSYSLLADKLLNQLDLTQQPALKKFLNDLAMREHGVSTCMIACLIGEHMGMMRYSMREVIPLGAYIHDIGLIELSDSVKMEKPELMNAVEKRLFEEHPRVGGALLEKLSNVNTILVDIVRKHHVRRDGKGFPKLSMVDRFPRAAEIVGMAELFSHLLSEMAPELAVKQMEEEHYRAFSLDIVDAFRNVFQLK